MATKLSQPLAQPYGKVELEKAADEINKAHVELEAYAKQALDAGVKAVEQAISCGNRLLRVKKTLGHGRFEQWCGRHLKFKIRTAQTYMCLAKQHRCEDILKLHPRSLRQALIHAGVLPAASDQPQTRGKFDRLSQIRRTAGQLLLQLQANEDVQMSELFEALQPLIEWTNRLNAKAVGMTNHNAVLLVDAQIERGSGPDVPAKTQHDALLPSASDQSKTVDDSAAVLESNSRNGSISDHEMLRKLPKSRDASEQRAKEEGADSGERLPKLGTTKLATPVRANRRPSSVKGRSLWDIKTAIKLVNRLRETIDTYASLPNDEAIKLGFENLGFAVDELLRFASNVSGVVFRN